MRQRTAHFFLTGGNVLEYQSLEDDAEARCHSGCGDGIEEKLIVVYFANSPESGPNTGFIHPSFSGRARLGLLRFGFRVVSGLAPAVSPELGIM
jgi:hypothetical protein